MIAFVYHYTRTPTLPLPNSGFPLRSFSNERPHVVNGLRNNTVCARIVNIVRTGPNLLPGRNQASHFPPLHRELLRGGFYSLLREHYHKLQRDPYNWLQRDSYLWIQREPLPSHSTVFLIPFHREIIIWIIIMELHYIDLAVTAGPQRNIIPNRMYPPVNGCLVNIPQLPNSS